LSCILFLFISITTCLAFLIAAATANILLIPRFGVMGAAFAAFTVAAIANGVQFFVGLRITPIPMDKKGLAIMFGSLFGGTVLLYILYYINLNLLIGIIVKLSMLGMFVLIAVMAGIISVTEIKQLVKMLKDKTIRVFAAV
jgi:hypothetical protein